MLGKRVFRVRVPRRPAEETDDRPPVYETYDTTMVGFEWHFVPRMYVQMESKAPFVVRCRESGLRAEVRRFADAQASLDAEAEEREGELAAAWAKIRELQAALAAAGG